MQWAKVLVVEINAYTNIDQIWRKKKTIILEAKNNLTGTRRLFELFKDALGDIPAHDDKVVRRRFYEVVMKTINARAGSVFKLFHELFVGHYSNKINIEFRKTLQVQPKPNTRRAQ